MQQSSQQNAQAPTHNADHFLDNSERVCSVASFIALALLTIAAGFVAAPVLLPLILAAITAGLADFFKLRIVRVFGKHRNLSATTTLVIMVVVVLAPSVFCSVMTDLPATFRLSGSSNSHWVPLRRW